MIPWQQIKDQTDIINLISEYLQVLPKSSNFVALCPFHDDKNPSLTISPDKKIWHCFGCGAGGDCFGFVAQIENITKAEAALKLATKLHIHIPKSDFYKNSYQKIENKNQSNSDNPAQNEKLKDLSNSEKESYQNQPKILSKHDTGLQYLDLAKRFYNQNLLRILKNPQHPVAIYCQKRGLTKEIIQEFQIGWSNSNSDFLKICQTYNLDTNLAFQTGILKKVDKKT